MAQTQPAPHRSNGFDRGLGEHSELVAGVIIGGLASYGVWFLVAGGDDTAGAGFTASVTGVVAALIVYTYTQRRAKPARNWLAPTIVIALVGLLALYAYVWTPEQAAVHAIVWIGALFALLATAHGAERTDPNAAPVTVATEPAVPEGLEGFFHEETAEPDEVPEPSDPEDTEITIVAPAPADDGPPPPGKD